MKPMCMVVNNNFTISYCSIIVHSSYERFLINTVSY